MVILVTGPAPVRELASRLGVAAESLPVGMPGTPVTRHVEALLDSGKRVTLVTLDRGHARSETWANAGLRVKVGPYRVRHRARDAFAVERSFVEKAIREEGPSIVHAHWTYEFALGAIQSEVPCLVTAHDWGPTILRYEPSPYRAVRMAMQLVALRRADGVTTVSPYLQKRIKWVSKRPPELIPNGVPLPRPQGRSAAPDARAPRLLAVNHGWSRRKNVDALLEAFKLVRRRWPEAVLELLGNEYGPGEAAQRWADNHDGSSNVLFTGTVTAEEVGAAMASCSIFVHPSLEESFGLVLVEAMLRKRPVVGGFKSGAVPWVLDAGQAGALTRVEDPRAIADTIMNLLNDEEGSHNLALRGYERAVSNFTTSAVTDRYIALYDRILDTR